VFSARRVALLARQAEGVRHVQERNWAVAGAFAGTALVAAAFLMWRGRVVRLRELEMLRQQISRDLHDEIGSSLGSIALITQEILASSGNSTQTREDLTEIKQIADETVCAMRDITRLIQSDRYGSDDLVTLLRDTAARLLRTVPHTLTVEAGTTSRKLPVDRQRDLILMFKEALYNITRHAEATMVGIKLTQTADILVLTTQDDGKGFDPAAVSDGLGLINLRRRVEKHQGRVDIVSSSQGTTLTLTLPLHA
jgi:signal transduction histidine kinase